MLCMEVRPPGAKDAGLRCKAPSGLDYSPQGLASELGAPFHSSPRQPVMQTITFAYALG